MAAKATTPKEPSKKAQAWVLFDEVVRRASADGYTNPWLLDARQQLEFRPDYATLADLLGVALHLKAPTTTGVPALALDVWVAYELRRAGFDPDAVWPRAEVPRILPATISALLRGLNKAEKAPIVAKLGRSTPIKGATAASAKILGKNYHKQVDVVMSAWDTGPEILISTKRMDSSFGKNAANRVEESYGDAKNLRSRHPQAALGFVYGLRSTILQEKGTTFEWIKDLLSKLGREDDAYDAVTLVMLDYYSETPPEEDDPGDGEDALKEAGLVEAEEDEELPTIPADELSATLSALPTVSLLLDKVPMELRPEAFFAKMTARVLDNSPVTLHGEARDRRASVQPPQTEL